MEAGLKKHDSHHQASQFSAGPSTQKNAIFMETPFIIVMDRVPTLTGFGFWMYHKELGLNQGTLNEGTSFSPFLVKFFSSF